MALMTTAEVKTFLRETSSTYDTLIGLYIPIIEEDICEYLNNYFEDRVIFIEVGSGLSFVGSCSSRDYISDDNQDFTTAGLSSGMDIAISGGSNYGIYSITSGQSSGTLNIGTTANKVFVDQDQDQSHHTVGTIRISRIIWPGRLKPIAAKMIWYQIKESKPNGAQSESIDDYSVTYVNGRAYPNQLLDQLKKDRYVRTH